MSILPNNIYEGNIQKEINKQSFPESNNKNYFKSEGSIKSSQTFYSDNILPSLSYSTSLNNSSNFFSSKEKIILILNNRNLTRELQKSLINKSKEDINEIISNLVGIFRVMIRNQNGNYFCSDLLKICNKDQRMIILKELSPTLSEDCCNEFATHPIQNLIELASNEEEFKLILLSFIDYNKIIMASLNQYGNYVIQKIIVNIPEHYRKDFNVIFVKFISVLSKDMYGICTVKKFISHTKNVLIVKEFLNIIMTNFMNISTNNHGNYIIQYLLEKWWNATEGTYIKSMVQSNFKKLMENNFSFYICNLYFKLCDNKEKDLILSKFKNCKYVNNAKNDNNDKVNKNQSLLLLYQNNLNVQKD